MRDIAMATPRYCIAICEDDVDNPIWYEIQDGWEPTSGETVPDNITLDSDTQYRVIGVVVGLAAECLRVADILDDELECDFSYKVQQLMKSCIQIGRSEEPH
jgi:hypothetical protein